MRWTNDRDFRFRVTNLTRECWQCGGRSVTRVPGTDDPELCVACGGSGRIPTERILEAQGQERLPLEVE